MPRRSGAHWTRVLSISAFLFIVVFKFQNCGSPIDAESSFAAETVDGEVRIIDRWQEQKISFLSDTHMVEKDLAEEVPEQKSIRLQGLCVGGGAPEPVAYELYFHPKGEANAVVQMASGTVNCRMGGFEILVSDINFSYCDDHYEVRAIRASGSGGLALTQIIADCGN